MKKFFGGLLAFASVGLASPALASSTFVVNQVADLQESWFEPGRSDLWVEAPSLVQIAGQDIVEGTLWFRGGHIRANNPATFYVSGRMHTIGGTVYESPIADVRLLNAQGETFGRTRPGYFDDTQYTGSFAPEEAMPFDVYGIKYRLAFRGIALGWALRSTDLDMSWWILTNASYAPGDVFTSAVPEPSSWAMMALGFAGLGLAMRRRRPTGAVALA